MRTKTAQTEVWFGASPLRAVSSYRRTAVSATSLLAFLLFSSCGGQGKLPAAPSDLVSGLTLYEDANYQGQSALLTQSIGNLVDFKGPCQHETDGDVFYDWNECISSMRIAQGWHATAFRDKDYKGDSLDVTADLPNLQLVRGDCDHDGMNDCISSIKLTPP
jgi:hypothetical protein